MGKDDPNIRRLTPEEAERLRNIVDAEEPIIIDADAGVVGQESTVGQLPENTSLTKVARFGTHY